MNRGGVSVVEPPDRRQVDIPDAVAAVARRRRLAGIGVGTCHGTAVTKCEVEDLDVAVTVEARVSLGRIAVGPARAAARAGPVEAGG
jgi:hypothetical protein